MATDPVTAMSAIPAMGLGDAVTDPDEIAPANDGGDIPLILRIAQSTGDITELFDDSTLGALGLKVVQDYNNDCSSRDAWEKPARSALEKATQEEVTSYNFPFDKASGAQIPILTIAASQFYARTYPAICKMGDMVKVRVIGSDKGRPMVGPQGPLAQVSVPGMPPEQVPVSQIQQMQQAAQAQNIPLQVEPVWQIAPGAKEKRAKRVSDYMNVYLQYRMKGWEKDTRLLLMQLPIIGCGFRKMWWADGLQQACFVSALDLVVPIDAKSLEDAPRITEKMENVFPFQIRKKMASGYYRPVVLAPIGDVDDDEAGRLLLEQHRWHDLDGDGVDEPYVITVDYVTSQVLRIEANFGVDGVVMGPDMNPIAVNAASTFYVQYDFFPNPKGHIYGWGLGHMLAKLGAAIDTILRQIIDAETMRIAGGGFIGAGLRLQGNGQTNTLKWQPGEYKNVPGMTGAQIRDAIFERTLPNQSPIMFQVLDLLLGQAKDISAVKDVLTGDASNQGQVGTTMALIEQGLMIYTAIYKSIYGSAGDEFMLTYHNIGTYGGEEAAEDYMDILDDPDADFATDFDQRDMNIMPSADPANVTNMQRAARAQAVGAISEKNPAANPRAILIMQYEALGVEDPESLLMPESAPPSPMEVAQTEKVQSEVRKNTASAADSAASAELKKAQVGRTHAETADIGVGVGIKLGEADGTGQNFEGSVPAVERGSDYPMGVPGA